MADDEEEEQRHWLHARQMPPTHDERFLFLSYNTLADSNARTHSGDLQTHIPALITDWNSRKRKLVDQILNISPDVICLQEVDRYHEFTEELQKSGYVGVYKRRTGACRDGCAVFWREARFALMEEQSIEFRDFKLRDNVAQICVLESKLRDDSVGFRDPGFKNLGFEKLGFRNRVVVGNVHVMFNPLRGEVKLGQARVFLENLHMMSGKWGNVPVAIAGDFNCTPWSPLYRFLSSSHLDLTGLNRRNISGQEEPPETEKRSRHKAPNRAFRVSESETVRKRSSAPQGWDQFEVMAATGERNLSALQHKLKAKCVLRN